MSAHTPGPWTLIPPRQSTEGTDEDELNLGGFKAGEAWVCSFGDSTQYYPSPGEPPSEADARLIAASPELLEAGASFLTVLDEYPEQLVPINRDSFLVRRLREAVAKATGAES